MSYSSSQASVFKFWFRPGATVRALLDAGQGHLMALIAGAAFGLVQAGRIYLYAEQASGGILVAGALAGLVGLCLIAYLLRNFGRWFGGQATFAEARTALGLGLIPWTLLFAGLIPALMSIEPEVIANWFPLIFVGFVYGYIILLFSISAALRLTLLKTFICLVVTFLVSMFPLTLLAQLMVKTLGLAS
ncbi:MAG: YIP1 family protein [Opitutaceae bacterium]